MGNRNSGPSRYGLIVGDDNGRTGGGQPDTAVTAVLSLQAWKRYFVSASGFLINAAFHSVFKCNVMAIRYGADRGSEGVGINSGYRTGDCCNKRAPPPVPPRLPLCPDRVTSVAV